MAFKDKEVTFSLADVGSQVIDQISSDIYSGPGSIIREIVKNAYDSYLKIDGADLDEEGVERAIRISRHRDSKGFGHLFLADSGTGQTFEGLKANVQISISSKPDELPDATGFRGLGSWAVLGAGSKIVITSTIKDSPTKSRLTVNVREIYRRMGRKATLDDILNDAKCISFSFEENPSVRAEHGTTVEIVCDGPTTTVNGFELNRLFDYTDPSEFQALRDLLVQHCPLPYRSEQGAYSHIHAAYQRAHYLPTAIYLDDNRLERSLPSNINRFEPIELTMGGTVVACGWFAEDPTQSSKLEFDDKNYLAGGPGIQIVKLNVPLGKKNLHYDGGRLDLMAWFVGEVHVISSDIRPNAGGDDFRAGLNRDGFIYELQQLYKRLMQRASIKSEQISLKRNLEKGIMAAADESMKPAQRETRIIKAVQALIETEVRGNPKSEKALRIKEAMSSQEMKDLRNSARKALKEGRFIEKYAPGATNLKKRARPKPPKPKATPNAPSGAPLPSGIHPQVAACLPDLEALDLTTEQIAGVLRIISSLVVELGAE